MDNREKMEKIAEILDLEVEELTEEAELDDFEEWDSIAKLSLTIMLSEDYGKKLTSEDIKEIKNVKMILELMD